MKVIDIHGLDKEDVELVKRLVKRLRTRDAATRGPADKESGFERAAGTWKDLVDPDELIADLYSRRTVSPPLS